MYTWSVVDWTPRWYSYRDDEKKTKLLWVDRWYTSSKTKGTPNSKTLCLDSCSPTLNKHPNQVYSVTKSNTSTSKKLSTISGGNHVKNSRKYRDWGYGNIGTEGTVSKITHKNHQKYRGWGYGKKKINKKLKKKD